MAENYWPVGLPLRIKYGTENEYGLEASKAITEYDGGNTLRRLRYTNGPFLSNVNLSFNDVEYENFLSFYMETLNKGIKNFIAPVLVGTRIEYHRCAFNNPSIKPVATDYNRWTVPVVFEIRGEVSMELGTFWFLGYYTPTLGEWICDMLQVIVNTDYPEAVDPYIGLVP